MANRVANFCAGPCTLPLSVLEEAQKEFVDFNNAGMSLFEMSHRAKDYDIVHNEAMTLAKEVYGVPEDFEVAFIQGGATLQFAMVPMNLLKDGQKGAYMNTGTWGGKAIKDGAHHGDIYTAWDGKEENFTRMPETSEIKLQPGTRYLHVTSNETIGGIRFVDFPEVDVPLVVDMSSDYMSREVPWDKFDLVYGGAQKNLGPAGMGVVFVRKSILEETNRNLAAYLRYDIHCSKDSLYNTPPVFAIYMMGKVMKWVKESGGLQAMNDLAVARSTALYNAIDNSDGYYNCPVSKAHRSLMNVVWRLPNEELEAKFVAEAKANDMTNLKGHRSVGGCRASIYNAMPMSGVEKLAEFMADFRKNNS